MDSTQSKATDTFFATRRERRLWTWTLALVLTIFATLGLASTLAEVLYNQGLSAVVFLTVMALVGLAILTQGLKTRPGGIEIGIGLGIAAVYLMVFLRLTIPERSHLIEYGVVAVFIYEALTERASHGRFVPVPAILAILLSSMIGVIDEIVQLFLPSRHFDKDDILFNLLASSMSIIAMVILGWGRRLAVRAIQGKTSEESEHDE